MSIATSAFYSIAIQTIEQLNSNRFGSVQDSPKGGYEVKAKCHILSAQATSLFTNGVRPESNRMLSQTGREASADSDPDQEMAASGRAGMPPEIPKLRLFEESWFQIE